MGSAITYLANPIAQKNVRVQERSKSVQNMFQTVRD